MTQPKLQILILFLLTTFSTFSQVDTVKHEKRQRLFVQYREKAYKFLVGGNLQRAKDDNNKEFSRKYFEIGLHKTITATYGHHPQTAFTHGLSIEIAPEKKTIFGFKYGGWVVFSLFVVGLNGIYYTDFKQGNFKIRPELGIGAYHFKLTFGL